MDVNELHRLNREEWAERDREAAERRRLRAALKEQDDATRAGYTFFFLVALAVAVLLTLLLVGG